MDRVTGTVCKRKLRAGVHYYAVAEYGRDAKGRRIRRWSKGFKNKNDAKDALVAMMADKDWIPSDGSTVKALIESYIKFAEGRAAEATTITRYRGLLANNIAPFIGSIQAEKLRGERLDALYAALRKEGGLKKRPLSSTTVKHTHDLISAAYKWAIRKNRVSRNPATDADPPSRKKVRGRSAQLGEARKIIAAFKGHRMEAPLLFAIATGMRRGEIVGLRDEHIDLDAGIARVCESVANAGPGKVYVKGTKTDEPREVPLSDLAIEALKIARLNRAKWKLKAGGMWIATDYIFVDEAGRRLHPNILTDAFRRICERLGLHYRLHDLRHTAATFMIRAGQDFGTVQKILGHATASTTLNIYSHVLKGAKAEALDALDHVLRKAVGDAE